MTNTIEEPPKKKSKADALLPDSLVVDPEHLEQLRKLTRNTSSTAPPIPESFATCAAPRRRLTQEEVATFKDNGFLVCKNWFSAEEVEMLSKTLAADSEAASGKLRRKDADNLNVTLTLWWYLGDDTFSHFGRSASLVCAASQLMDGREPYHSHTKLLLKEPHTGGAWEWHQDFGYWYTQGVLQPDGIIDAIIAIDKNTDENGCMRLMRHSHKLGRLDHGTFGGQGGADPAKVLAATKLPGHDIVSLHLEPGDVAFMHSNTLHCSAPNYSDKWRRNMIVAYNSKHNGPLPGSPEGQPEYSPIQVVADEALVKVGVVPVDAARSQFLTQA